MERNGWGRSRLPPERRFHRRVPHFTDQTDNLGFATHVRLECMGVAAGLQNALAEFFSCLTTIEVIDGNVRTNRCLHESNGSAKPREAPVMRVVCLEFGVLISASPRDPMVCEPRDWICPLQRFFGETIQSSYRSTHAKSISSESYRSESQLLPFSRHLFTSCSR
jgi:hypothetical protein